MEWAASNFQHQVFILNSYFLSASATSSLSPWLPQASTQIITFLAFRARIFF